MGKFVKGDVVYRAGELVPSKIGEVVAKIVEIVSA